MYEDNLSEIKWFDDHADWLKLFMIQTFLSKTMVPPTIASFYYSSMNLRMETDDDE